jgi:hypothetical protein
MHAQANTNCPAAHASTAGIKLLYTNNQVEQPNLIIILACA